MAASSSSSSGGTVRSVRMVVALALAGVCLVMAWGAYQQGWPQTPTTVAVVGVFLAAVLWPSKS